LLTAFVLRSSVTIGNILNADCNGDDRQNRHANRGRAFSRTGQGRSARNMIARAEDPGNPSPQISKAVVRESAARLTKDGARVWLHEEQIKPGDSIVANIEERLEDATIASLGA
jgi:hypothetical protein